MRKNIFIFACLLCAGLAVYGGSLWNPFILDDEPQILENSFVHTLDLKSLVSGSTFASYGAETPQGTYYKPLMPILYGVFWNLGGEQSFLFHLAQFLFAVLNAFFFYYILATWIPRTTAFMAALIFLLHPINSEVILYIADLQDTMYMFWGLLALVLILKKFKWPLVALCLLLSVLFKETGALFVLILPLYAYLLDRTQLKKAGLAASFSVLSYLLFRGVTAGFQRFTVSGIPITDADLSTRLLTFPKSAFYYLKTFLWPETLSLNQNWIIRDMSWADFWLPLLCITLLCFAILALIRTSVAKTQHLLIFLFAIFILNSGLHANILTPLDATHAERWFYLGSLALIGIMALAANSALEKKPALQKVLLSLSVLVVLGLAGRSFQRAQDWGSPMVLFTKEVQTNPNDFSATNVLGLTYFRAGNLEQAEAYFRRSVQAAPQLWVNWNNLGAVEDTKGNFKLAEQYYAQSINNGQYPKAILNYARLLKKQNRNDELGNFLKEALLTLPNNPVLIELQKSLIAN